MGARSPAQEKQDLGQKWLRSADVYGVASTYTLEVKTTDLGSVSEGLAFQ